MALKNCCLMLLQKPDPKHIIKCLSGYLDDFSKNVKICFLSNRFQNKIRKIPFYLKHEYANLFLKWPWAEYIQEGNWIALLPYHGPLYSFHNKRHILTSKRGPVMSLTSSFHLFGGSNRSKEFHRVLCKRETSKETF